MSCSSCAYLDVSKKKYFVNGCNNSCNDYKSSYRTNYECNKIYDDGRIYCDDTTAVWFYLVILIILVILGLIFNMF